MSFPRSLTVLLLILIGGHLILGTLEVLYRPVFPWDAWLNWMYRAKALYLSGATATFDPVSLWTAGQEPENPYAVAGQDYPLLLPFLTVGVATLLGGWSETLVNMPTAVLGLLLATGTFGLGRRCGLPPVLALAAAYAVVSTPLAGAHLALAGQADIWMTATSGLGFAALYSAAIHPHRHDLLLGLALVTLGALIKAEGVVWLALAVLFLGVLKAPRRILGTGAIVLLALALIVVFGPGTIDLPVLGRVGLSETTLHIPLLGSHTLQRFDLGDDYAANFLLGASWNLLWYGVVLATIVALARVRRDRGARSVLALFFCVALGQISIFFFTEQGAWAEDWTAINRLPLHFLPAITVAVFVTFWRAVAATGDAVGSDTATITAKTTCLGLLAGSLLVLPALYAVSTVQPEASQVFPGQQLRSIRGAWAPYRDGLTLQRYASNIGMLSTGPTRVIAEDTPFVQIESEGTNRGQGTFFWRQRAGGPLSSKSFAGVGNVVISLEEEEAWSGAIHELGVIFYDDGGQVRVRALRTFPASWASAAYKVATDLLWINPWSQRSVHWLPGGNPDALLPIPAIPLGLFLVLAACLIPILRAPALPAGILGAFLMAWILCDLAWLYQRGHLAQRTVATYAFAGSGPLAYGDDAISYANVRRALCDIPPAVSTVPAPTVPSTRLLIASDSDADMRFQLLRAKYHALPVAAHAHEGLVTGSPAGLARRILVLKLRYGRDSARTVSSGETIQALTRSLQQPFRLAWESDDAFLLARGPADEDPTCWSAGT